MANERVVLRAHFDEWKRDAGKPREIDPWVYYCLEQFLKPYSLDPEEIEFGITDRGGDGGADGIYFFVNQGQLVDADTELDPKSVTKVRLIFFQVKTSGGVKPTEIEKWLPLTDDFFDLTKNPEQFGTRYNEKVKQLMGIWREQFLRVASAFPEIVIDYHYITGDDAIADDYALDACDRIEEKARKQTNGECTVYRVGAAELLQQIRLRPPKSRQIEWAIAPMHAEDGSVGLVTLPKFCKFLEDSPGVLAERIFESNVRGYLKKTTVNEQIEKTLGHSEPNFWLLNNGVTIIAAKAIPTGPMAMTVEDPQVVNGLQTSREIFAYFKKNPNKQDTRAVLVRIIPTANQAVSDEIIAATNNQNQMPAASLRMTDHVHRDIEQIFKQVGWFYDRRKGFYRDQGKPIRRIISVNAVAQAVIAILLQRPDDARARPGDYFKDNERYKQLFDNPKIPVGAYLACVQIVEQVDDFLEGKSVAVGDRRNLKFYVAALAAREATGIMLPPASKINPKNITDGIVADSYKTVRKFYQRLSEHADGDAVARGPLLLRRIDNTWNRAQRKNSRGTNAPKPAVR